MAVAPRVVRILPRGNWLDDSGEIVAAGRARVPRPAGRQGPPGRRGSTWPSGSSPATTR